MAADLLTADEVSTRLAVDRSTIHRMAMDGRLLILGSGSMVLLPHACVTGVEP